MIQDVGASVQQIYLLIDTILENFSYISDISVLVTVYCLMAYCYRHANAKSPPKFLQWVHIVVCIILSGLWGAIMYYSIAYEVHFILRNYEFGLIDHLIRIDVAFQVLYLCAVLEILAWAVQNKASSILCFPVISVLMNINRSGYLSYPLSPFPSSFALSGFSGLPARK